MYYIDDEITFHRGLTSVTYGFHYISRIQIDYVNNKTEIQISSTESKEKWIEDDYTSPFVNFYALERVPGFNEDPNNTILRYLVTLPVTVFNGKRVKKLYDLPRIPIHKSIKD